MQFTKTFYEFDVRGDAKIGDIIGRVWVTLPADSSGVVVYFLRPRSDFFDVNRTTGVVHVIRDLSEWTSRRRRRRQGSVSAERKIPPVRRRRRSLVPVELHVVAQFGHFEAEATIQLAINRTLCCGPPDSRHRNSGLAGTPLILLIVLLSLAIIVAGVVTIVCLRRRRTKTPVNGGLGYSGSTGAESSSLETFDVPLPPPPAYGEDAMMRRRRYDATHCPTTTLGANDYDDEYSGDGCESSGRGSAEKPITQQCAAADHEIRMINSGGGGGGGSARGTACPPRRLGQPDSGIQPDHDGGGGDAGSTGSGRPPRTLGPATSVDSMHQFYDEGGGEASVSELSPGSPCFDQPVIDADQLLLIAANSQRYGGAADYLLNWKPEYQPLADVFAEIARLPDDTSRRGVGSAVAKTCPTHIVPQPPAVNHRLGSASTAHSGPRPPPIITAAPPRAVRVATATADNDSVTSSTRSSTSSNHRQLQQQQHRQPPSSSHQQSSFTQPSRDVTCSVSYNTPGQPLSPGSSTRSRSSDREIHI